MRKCDGLRREPSLDRQTIRLSHDNSHALKCVRWLLRYFQSNDNYNCDRHFRYRNSAIMATALQKQLAAIAASSTHQLDLKAQKSAHGKSLLFDTKTAASQSFDTLYLICHEGYRDLCALDSRFLPFAKSLFSEQSKIEDRTQMTKDENKKLDAVLEAFITLVGPKLLLKPAQKALEWLVRRFRCVKQDGCIYSKLPSLLVNFAS